MCQSGSKTVRPAPPHSDTARGRTWLRRVGILVFIASFLVPNAWAPGKGQPGVGAWAFGAAAVALLGAVLGPADQWQAPQVFSNVCLAVAFLANFTVFFRFRGAGALLVIAAPWVAIGCSPAILQFMPFYLWALGIGLIHASRA